MDDNVQVLHEERFGGGPNDSSPDNVAPDTAGMNFFDDDADLCELLRIYMDPKLLEHLRPHLSRLGSLAAGRLDELARTADKNPPVLHHRDARGRDRQWIECHPAYREMQRFGFSEFGLAAMSNRGGVLGWPDPIAPIAKYMFTFLFTQAEFGLYCPISMTDATARVLLKFGSEELKQRFLPGIVSTDFDRLTQGAMFMTEKQGGSDVGATETVAKREGDRWRLCGEKWFCSNADADVILLLARPEGAQAGTRGLGLFLMPRFLEDGSPNHYRIVRLKDKLGTRSMPSGEVILDGAVGYVVGDLNRGFAQMTEMVNVSRLSNGVRAGAIMKRSLHDALHVARNRLAFGKPIIEHPLLRRQLVKMMVPTEEALSVSLFAALSLERWDAGEEEGRLLTRLLTPLLKFRACRDARRVTGDAMEVRGGNGYIEEWSNPRLLRDAHLGSIWEGTSNMVALDLVTRAVGKERADRALISALKSRLDEIQSACPNLCRRITEALDRSVAFAREVAGGVEHEQLARQAATGLYHATAAALLAWEGFKIGSDGGNPRRLILARLVVDNHLSSRDPLTAIEPKFEAALTTALLDPAGAALQKAIEWVESK